MRFYATLASTILLLTAVSCSNDNEPTIKPDGPSRTILVYMVATNSLSDNVADDIEEMMQGMTAVEGDDCHLLVYEANYNADPMLYEITSANGKASISPLKTYQTTTSSASVERMSEVISDAVATAPAESYGLVLWSHATGWVRVLESASKSSGTVRPTDFADDNGQWMTISDLAKAIPDGLFDFIYADACYMGCIEIAYQLRDKANYYIASPTETLSPGMPYDENIPCFFKETADLVAACQNTYNYYASRASSATIALIDCSKLEQTADLCHQIHSTTSVTEVNTSELQCYNRASRSTYFDFFQYTSLLASPQQATELYDIANQLVPYKAATAKFLTINIDPDHYSGLSTYIMGTASDFNEQYYTTLDWYKRIYEQ